MSISLPHNGAFKSEWSDAPTALREQAYAIEQAVEQVPFVHGIRNWHMVLVTGQSIRKAGEFRDGPIPDMVAVFCVNPTAWDKSHPDFWSNAGFSERARYLDDHFSIQRGSSSLQRDRAMISVGIAAGASIAKACTLGFMAERSHDYDSERLGQLLGLPKELEVAAVIAIGKRRNVSASPSWSRDRISKSSLGHFE